MYSLFLSIFSFLALHVSAAICTHPQKHKLQRTAIGVCNVFGMLIHLSRYWLGHTYTVSVVRFELQSESDPVRVSQPVPAQID
jgi:hypothetical protein